MAERSRPAYSSVSPPPRAEMATAALMRRINRSAVLDFLRCHSPAARSHMARRLGLSLPTVMRILNELIDEGLVRADGTSPSPGGRPSSLVSFNGDAHAVVAVDMGETAGHAVLADLSGTVLGQSRLARVGNDPFEALCGTIAALLETPLPQGCRVWGIGVGVPSVILNPEGVLNWAPGIGWRAVPLRQMLMERFGLPVVVENDMNLATLGEAAYGVGRGTECIMCIMLGTGIGAGVTVRGTIHRGAHQAAGEVGYMLPGLSFLGRTYDHFGALESQASLGAIVERACVLRAESGPPNDSGDMKAEDVFAAAERGEEWGRRVLEETADCLSLALVNASTVLDPELVVVGSRLDLSLELLVQLIRDRLQGVLPFPPRVEPSDLGYRAPLLGAVTLVLETLTGHVSVKPSV